jgi:hypothetical protein
MLLMKKGISAVYIRFDCLATKVTGFRTTKFKYRWNDRPNGLIVGEPRPGPRLQWLRA